MEDDACFMGRLYWGVDAWCYHCRYCGNQDFELIKSYDEDGLDVFRYECNWCGGIWEVAYKNESKKGSSKKRIYYYKKGENYGTNQEV